MSKIYLILIAFLLIPLVSAYDCLGTIVEEDGKLLCVTCNEGFEMEDGNCVPENNYKENISIIDKVLYRFFPENPLLGLFILVLICTGIYYIFKNRRHFIRELKSYK